MNELYDDKYKDFFEVVMMRINRAINKELFKSY